MSERDKATERPWTERLTREQAIKILDYACDKDDPNWEHAIECVFGYEIDCKDWPVFDDVIAVISNYDALLKAGIELADAVDEVGMNRKCNVAGEEDDGAWDTLQETLSAFRTIANKMGEETDG